VRPQDLRHHLLLPIHDAKGRWPWLSWAAWLEAAGVEDFTPSGTLSFDQYDQVVQAAIHGQGVALGRMTIASQPIREQKLVVLFGRQQRIARGFHAVFSKGARERPEVRQFVDWLRQEIGSEVA
jgi:DNA-binding transcriptional LysR family regulator